MPRKTPLHVILSAFLTFMSMQLHTTLIDEQTPHKTMRTEKTKEENSVRKKVGSMSASPSPLSAAKSV